MRDVLIPDYGIVMKRILVSLFAFAFIASTGITYAEDAEIKQNLEETVDQYITVGDLPGDAQCINLSDSGFFSFLGVPKFDWEDILGRSPRVETHEKFLSIESDERFGYVIQHRFEPSDEGSARVRMGVDLEGHKTYRVVQNIFLKEGWDWGGDEYEGGKLGFGFGSGTYPTGGEVDPRGFTARIMWRGNYDGSGRLVVYSYAADRDGIDGVYGEDLWLGEKPFPIGQWVELVLEVTANSSIEQPDGSIRVWIDGELRLEKNDIGWQLAGEEPIIDQLFYSGFYGGKGRGWAPEETTRMLVADVCWAPVVDGYSGIDPDKGITKLDPER